MGVYEYIRTETDPTKLYDGIRAILKKLDEKGRYPEDWEIKRMQRAADARYLELTEGLKK